MLALERLIHVKQDGERSVFERSFSERSTAERFACERDFLSPSGSRTVYLLVAPLACPRATTVMNPRRSSRFSAPATVPVAMPKSDAILRNPG